MPRSSDDSDDDLNLEDSEDDGPQDEGRNARVRAHVRLPRLRSLDDYIDFAPGSFVETVLDEVPGDGEVEYEVRYRGGALDILPYDKVIAIDGGQEALDAFENVNDDDSEDDLSAVAPPQRKPTRPSRRSGHSEIIELESSPSEAESASSSSDSQRIRARPKPGSRHGIARPGRSTNQGSLRRSGRQTQAVSSYRERRPASSSEDDLDVFASDLMPRTRKRKRNVVETSSDDDHRTRREGLRTSGRSTRNQARMLEGSLNDVYRSDSDGPAPAPKAAVTSEVFKSIPRSDPFALRHVQQCDTCGNRAGPQGHLIYCQGCALSYHKACLGHRHSREHLVTKIADDEFVLQCRRCINMHKRREATAPDHAICQSCREAGPACAPLRVRKNAAQEAKEREENDGIDPIVEVDVSLINNPSNVMFRCNGCSRAFHFHHLSSKTGLMDIVGDDDMIAEERFREYGQDWLCKECYDMPAKISGLVAWRPVDQDDYVPDTDTTEVYEDDKEYLIHWEKLSYFQAQWMPGAWAWALTATSTRKSFAKRNNQRNLPIMKTEDAIPEDYLRVDIILDVKFTSIVEARAEEIDKARIREVDTALIKYKGLGYEDAVWEKVPGPEDGDRWSDFVKAYDDWVVGRYVKMPKSGPLKIRIDKARDQDFNELEKKEQPKNLVGGQLMKYQLQGVNWLYYRWHQQKNGILADEMGLGKTIQIIGMLATLTEEHNCFPFLLVVPNSTCANWRREIKQWAPSLRVVTYFGSAQARRMAYEHELFPEGSKTLKCHLVVTSYEAAADDSCRRFFKSVPWQGLIVDEGQRLKSDKTNLYGALSALKIPFTILLTGTPLQNNARELFNLLQFLDRDFDAESLELEYATLTKENIPQLHEMIRPFFLRRTKAEVLTFLPSLAQVIVPVSMTVVQRKLYKTILSKNPDLMRAIFSADRPVSKSDRGNLNNLLMQLRKTLAHPFTFSQDIEERNVSEQTSFRNLVDASSKLQLLEILLPKLRENGHRVLIFTQFLGVLDIIEDFLDGMDMRFQRLDGTVSALQKQKRIDQFNAPDSPLFAFLLSTRAGGVGINLATADTVIILDPDFNPHQDIQALSRAHRIGQTKKVLCFQLMTSSSVEEKIMQVGRAKMALDHLLIEQMDAGEENLVDVETVLKHGAAAILEGDTSKDIHYDDASVEKLLDRSQVEDTKAGDDATAESQFSFARVWANDTASLMDSLDGDNEERVPDAGVWERILQERERIAAEEAASRHEALGRGRRSKQNVDYSGIDTLPGSSPTRANRRRESESDTDFQENEAEEEEPDEGVDHVEVAMEAGDIGDDGVLPMPPRTLPSQPGPPGPPGPPPDRKRQVIRQWRRSNVTWPIVPSELPTMAPESARQQPPPISDPCMACSTPHRQGYCPLKIAGPEFCNLCSMAHFGRARTCPHIRSETQIRAMLRTLKQSREPRELVQEAYRYLAGVRGSLAQNKRQAQTKKAQAAAEAAGVPGVLDPAESASLHDLPP